MVRYLLKRLGRGILTILLSVTLVFFIVRAMPSNPVDLMVSPQMSEEAQQALIEEFGLDQSKLTQYGLYMKELLHGNLGSSFAKRIPVSQYIAEKLPWTLLLLAAVMLIVILIGISVGLLTSSSPLALAPVRRKLCGPRVPQEQSSGRGGLLPTRLWPIPLISSMWQ